MKHLKGTASYGANADDVAACLKSLNKAVKSVPKGKWVTFRDLCDFMRYNDLDLSIPRGFTDAFVTAPTEWGGRGHQRIVTTPVALWEEPLLRAYLAVLTAVGALDAVIAVPQDRSDMRPTDSYVLTTDALKAVRLTPIGEWYFQNGPETCFEAQAQGEVVLDERRLFIRLTGSNPVLRVALEQVALPVGSGFYRIDGGSFLRDCDSKDHVKRKVDALKALLPNALPPIWETFFAELLLRINPLAPVDFIVLRVGDSAELRRLLLADSVIRPLTVMAEGGRILVRDKHRDSLKKRLKELGYFIDSF